MPVSAIEEQILEPEWLNPDQQRAWRNYIEATTLLLDALDRQLQRDAGMPHGYYEILVRLSERPERTMRMSELAEATRSSRSRLSHAVSRLEERGWIVRRDCETDRRGQLAGLTPAGLAALERAAPGHVAEVRKHVIDRLSPDQVTQLADIADVIVAGLSETD